MTEYAYYPGADRLHSMFKSDTFYYYFTDHLGSVIAIADSQGTLQNRYEYDTWGYIQNPTENVGNRFGFTGREYDSETGFYYYRARYYDPATGRFISEDPIGLAGGLNPYAYAGNSPLSARDPSGLQGDLEEQDDEDCPGGYPCRCDYRTGEGCDPGVFQLEEIPVEVERRSAFGNWLIEQVFEYVTDGVDQTLLSGAGGAGGSTESDLTSLEQMIANLTPDWLVPIGKCVDRYNNPAGDLALIANAALTELVGTKTRAPYAMGTRFAYTSWQRVAGNKMAKITGLKTFKVAGRVLGRATAGLTVLEGSYDIGIIAQCATGLLGPDG